MLALDYTSFYNSFYENELVFPVLECLHIAAMAVSVGTIAIVDFRLLGLGMVKQDPTDLTKQMIPFTMIGLGVALAAGGLLYMSDPDMYYLNYIFIIKMILLVLGLTFQFTIRKRMIASGGAQGTAAALISIGLWGGVIFGGIFTAFV